MKDVRMLPVLVILGLLATPFPRLEAQSPPAYEIAPVVVPPEYFGLVYVVDINNAGTVLGWLFPERLVALVIRPEGVATFTIPGALYFQPAGLTADGRIAGLYFDADRIWRQFVVDRRGRIAPVIVPGDWDIVVPRDISDNGNIIVGEGVRPGRMESVGFIQDRKSTRFFAHAGAPHTTILAVNNAGLAAGSSGGSLQSFLLRRDGSYEDLSSEVYPLAINNAGVIAGTCGNDAGGAVGCVLRDGVRTDLEYPAPPTIEYTNPETGMTGIATLSGQFTELTGINDHGVVVGYTGGLYFGDGLPFELERFFPFTGTPAR